jgi:hypothetical protein
MTGVHRVKTLLLHILIHTGVCTLKQRSDYSRMDEFNLSPELFLLRMFRPHVNPHHDDSLPREAGSIQRSVSVTGKIF